MGPGLKEIIYERALSIELTRNGIVFERQLKIPVYYRGEDLGIGFRIDMLVEGCLVLEMKSVSALLPLHLAQVMNYLHILNIKRGFLLNFNSRILPEGMKRVSI